MKSVCANCDLGLKRSACNEDEYIECEFRRWAIEIIKRGTIHSFWASISEVLDSVYENENDAKRNKAKLVYYFSKELIE